MTRIASVFMPDPINPYYIMLDVETDGFVEKKTLSDKASFFFVKITYFVSATKKTKSARIKTKTGISKCGRSAAISTASLEPKDSVPSLSF